MEFEKKFVHCMYDESLVGKTCIFADDLPSLKKYVETCDEDYISVLQAPSIGPNLTVDELMYPFYRSLDSCYRFVYYDPNLECKIAREQGKQIQYFDGDEWCDTNNPTWNPDIEYRVKPDEKECVPYESVSEMMYEHFNVDNIEDIKNCIWVRLKADTSVRLMITGTDLDKVLIDGTWAKLPVLLEEFLWDDFTAIGK